MMGLLIRHMKVRLIRRMMGHLMVLIRPVL
jgi:hypothetical protein